MRLGDARIGLVALQRDTPWTAEQLDRTQEIVEDSALMLDTAFVFGDVRLLATTEERRRLAREIHDGIAQEIAGLAYVVDDIAARETDPALEEDLRTVREELGRVVSELRLSIFELRTVVEPGARLGASMSDYVRQVGARAGMGVHISLDENTARLPADVEVEIMRIVQESVTNARRTPGQNLG
jgi:signal transduction histidine kinase